MSAFSIALCTTLSYYRGIKVTERTYSFDYQRTNTSWRATYGALYGICTSRR
nr:MAG TPA: hypothetical protein [Caudoviricetes sp.]